MPYVEMTSNNTKERYLISGFSNYGKTYNSMTFLFGRYDYLTQPDKALEYAGDKQMVVLSCPGEFGTRRALDKFIARVPKENLRAFLYEPTEKEASHTLAWSNDAMSGFNAKVGEYIKKPPHILLLDGIHGLWDHIANRLSQGAFLDGSDLSVNGKGTVDKYRRNALYDQTHNVFGGIISRLYDAPIPLIIATIWEDWKTQKSDASVPGDISDDRFLWCDVPGKMATRVVGKFDGRLSAMLSPECFHDDCVNDKAKKEHFVWQFYPRGSVKGVGIKGLRLTEEMKRKPYIHQNYVDLKELMDTFT